MEADTRARHRTEEKIADARLRLIARLEAIAYADPRDVIQWNRKPKVDKDGNVTGWTKELVVTPSHLLTREQAAMVKSITTKGDGIKFEVNDQLTALAQLAKILGLTADQAPTSVANTQVNVGQVNVVGGGDNGLESLRRLAFAIEKTCRAQEAGLLEAKPSHAPNAEPKGSTVVEGQVDPAK